MRDVGTIAQGLRNSLKALEYLDSLSFLVPQELIESARFPASSAERSQFSQQPRGSSPPERSLLPSAEAQDE